MPSRGESTGKGGGGHEPKLRGGIWDLVDEQLAQSIDVLLFDSSSFLRTFLGSGCLPPVQRLPYLQPICNFLVDFGDALDPV